MLAAGGKINCCLAGRILFPERPILCLCTLVVDGNIRNSTMRCFYIFTKGAKILLFSPFKPLLSLSPAHRLVTLKPVNLFSALYCSKPLPVPAIRARYAC